MSKGRRAISGGMAVPPEQPVMARRRAIEQGRADICAGRRVSLQQIDAWIDSLDTPDERPVPQSSKRYGYALIIASVVVSLSSGTCMAEAANKQATYDPENRIRPIRALLAISEEPVKPNSSCDQGRLIATKPGPPQIGDMVAILLAYHGSGINVVRGSCEKDGDSSCSVVFMHKKSAQAEQEFAVIKFKIVSDKAQPDSLDCQVSP